MRHQPSAEHLAFNPPSPASAQGCANPDMLRHPRTIARSRSSTLAPQHVCTGTKNTRPLAPAVPRRDRGSCHPHRSHVVCNLNTRMPTPSGMCQRAQGLTHPPWTPPCPTQDGHVPWILRCPSPLHPNAGSAHSSVPKYPRMSPNNEAPEAWSQQGGRGRVALPCPRR